MICTKHGVTLINSGEGTSLRGKDDDVFICSLEENKLTWIREMKLRLFMQRD